VVDRAGFVQMDGDSPVVNRLPVNWVRNTSPFRRRVVTASAG
jgi:hypothetical protein